MYRNCHVAQQVCRIEHSAVDAVVMPDAVGRRFDARRRPGADPEPMHPDAAVPQRRANEADDEAVVLALGTTDDDQVARLRTGEATSLVLLTATALGLASCPVTEPLEIDETREAIRTDVFGTSGYPQMLLRVGWAPVNAEPLASTPRRALADVVEWLDGSAFD
jgi:nitroreductase